MTHVFLSYARDDAAFVTRLILALEARGVPVWVDRDDIPGGAAWEAAISDAVRTASALVVVLSPAAAGSEYVPREVSLADKHDRPIVPVLLAPWEQAAASERSRRLEFQLTGVQYVDFAEQPFDAGVQDLLAALRTGRTTRPAAAAAPAGGSRRWLLAALATGAALAAGAAVAVWLGRRDTAPAVAGEWVADVAYGWGTRATERFRFALDGEAVSGTASFLGVPRGIVAGRLADGRLVFQTRIDAGPGSPAFANEYRGRLAGDAIEFVLQDDRGSSPVTFTASRSP